MRLLSRFTKSGCALHPYIFRFRLACCPVSGKPNGSKTPVFKIRPLPGLLLKKQSAPSAVSPRLLNVREAAQYLACSVHAIRQLQWSSAIPSLKIGKLIQFDRQDLDRYVDAQKG